MVTGDESGGMYEGLAGLQGQFGWNFVASLRVEIVTSVMRILENDVIYGEVLE